MGPMGSAMLSAVARRREQEADAVAYEMRELAAALDRLHRLTAELETVTGATLQRATDLILARCLAAHPRLVPFLEAKLVTGGAVDLRAVVDEQHARIGVE